VGREICAAESPVQPPAKVKTKTRGQSVPVIERGCRRPPRLLDQALALPMSRGLYITPAGHLSIKDPLYGFTLTIAAPDVRGRLFEARPVRIEPPARL
jgi:hypothetical protein